MNYFIDEKDPADHGKNIYTAMEVALFCHCGITEFSINSLRQIAGPVSSFQINFCIHRL